MSAGAAVARYKPTNPLRKNMYEVREVPLSTCQELVRTYHYAHGGSNTATYRHGLFQVESDKCLGVAWWIPPTRSCAEASWDGDWRQVIALSRVVIVPGVPTNACSFLISRSIKAIQRDGRFRCLVTYADQWQKHEGTIYKALGWEYIGLTTPEPTFVDSAGRMVARKAGPKTRTRAEMQELGYAMIGRFSKHKFRKILDV